MILLIDNTWSSIRHPTLRYTLSIVSNNLPDEMLNPCSPPHTPDIFTINTLEWNRSKGSRLGRRNRNILDSWPWAGSRRTIVVRQTQVKVAFEGFPFEYRGMGPSFEWFLPWVIVVCRSRLGLEVQLWQQVPNLRRSDTRDYKWSICTHREKQHHQFASRRHNIRYHETDALNHGRCRCRP